MLFASTFRSHLNHQTPCAGIGRLLGLLVGDPPWQFICMCVLACARVGVLTSGGLVHSATAAVRHRSCSANALRAFAWSGVSPPRRLARLRSHRLAWDWLPCPRLRIRPPRPRRPPFFVVRSARGRYAYANTHDSRSVLVLSKLSVRLRPSKQ
jgi:hypothetical protein